MAALGFPAIVSSFEQVGQTASGSGPLSPSDVFVRGSEPRRRVDGSATSSAFLTNHWRLPGAASSPLLLTVLSFIAITIQFVVALVESYIIVSAGVIFLGFGGSGGPRPTSNATSASASLLASRSPAVPADRSGWISLTWMDAAKHRDPTSERRHVCVRDYGRFAHLHDAVLADS